MIIELFLPLILLGAVLIGVLLWGRWKINSESKDGER